MASEDDFGAGSALVNPNDRRRINKISRRIAQYDLKNNITNVDTDTLAGLARDSVGQWMGGNRPLFARKAFDEDARAKFTAAIARGKVKKGEPGYAEKKARALAYAKIRRQVAKAFEAADPFAYGTGYAQAALGSHASRYRLKAKKGLLDKTKHGKSFKIARAVKGQKGVYKTVSYHPRVVSIPGVLKLTNDRYTNRAEKQTWGKTLPFAPVKDHFARGVSEYELWTSRFGNGGSGEVAAKKRGGRKAKALANPRTKKAFKQEYQVFSMDELRPKDMKSHVSRVGMKKARLKSEDQSFRKLVESGALASYGFPVGYIRTHKRKLTQKQLDTLAAGRAKRAANKANKNPGSALMNPSYDSVVPFVTEYAVPVAVVGAVAGGVHFAAQKFGVTEKITAGLEMIPVVGAPVAQYAPFTVQGLVAGSLLAVGASMVGGAAGKYLAMAAGGAIAFGGGIDMFNYLSGQSAGSDDATGDLAFGRLYDPMGDLAMTNTSALGDIAFTNESSLGDLGAIGAANPSFSAASLSAEDYTQSTLGDALYSGADFSGAEGQALVNGKQSFLSRFGFAPIRAAGRVANKESHLAGREGHRWGWLIKMIGWERARKLAAMPPRQRVALLAKLRKAAVQAFQESVALDLAAQAAASSQLSSGANAVDVAKARQLAQAAEAGVPGVPSDLELPAAGQVLSGAFGAAGAACANGSDLGGADYLGDPTLFMGA